MRLFIVILSLFLYVFSVQAEPENEPDLEALSAEFQTLFNQLVVKEKKEVKPLTEIEQKLCHARKLVADENALEWLFTFKLAKQDEKSLKRLITQHPYGFFQNVDVDVVALPNEIKAKAYGEERIFARRVERCKVSEK